MILLIGATTPPVAAVELETPAKQTDQPHKIVIAVSSDETITITMDGKPISCAELKAHFANRKDAHVRGIDCKLLTIKPNQ
jgi:hypothetical protein